MFDIIVWCFDTLKVGVGLADLGCLRMVGLFGIFVLVEGFVLSVFFGGFRCLECGLAVCRL